MHLDSASAWCWLFVCTGTVALILVIVHLIHSLGTKRKVSLFYCWLGALAVWGGSLAFLLPIALNSGFGKDHDGSALRQALLYATGGVLAVITLGETHRKNSQEKEKNENDHIRQVHAERRSRYAKAIEQLADDKSAVRLGGIYTLAKLADEWLSDVKTMPSKGDRTEEAQIIINSLCAYIRSPFLFVEKLEVYEARKDLNELEGYEAVFSIEEGSPQLQSLHKRVIDSNEYKEPEDIAAAYAERREEQNVRRAIFIEISKRLKVSQDKVSVISSAWSDFEFDFSRAPIFYPLNNLTIGKAIFSSARFYGEANFRDTEFTKDADFGGAKFTGNADFGGAKFAGTTYFWGAQFAGTTYFLGSEFAGTARFNSTHFENYAPIFADTFGSARFSDQVKWRDSNFLVHSRSKPIELGSATLGDKTFSIPFGTVVFDPDSWDEKTKEYTHMSVTCCRIQRSPQHQE